MFVILFSEIFFSPVFGIYYSKTGGRLDGKKWIKEQKPMCVIKWRQVWGTKSAHGADLVFDLGNLRVSSTCSLENPGSPCLASCVVWSISCVQLFVTPWAAACQASLSFTISWSSLKFISIESMMPSNHLILCQPFLLLHSIFPRIRVFSNELAVCIKWPKY